MIGRRVAAARFVGAQAVEVDDRDAARRIGQVAAVAVGMNAVAGLQLGDFLGRDVMLKAKEEGLKRLLVGLEIEGKVPARHGYEIFKDGKHAGHVTSGTISPSLKKAIAMAYVDKNLSEVGTKLTIKVRDRELNATVVPTPFYPGEPSKD